MKTIALDLNGRGPDSGAPDNNANPARHALVVVGLNHRTASTVLREQFEYNPTESLRASAELQRQGIATEAVVVSTCNRTEFYVVGPASPDVVIGELRQYLATQRGYVGPIEQITYAHIHADCVRHLFRVASGLDSLVIGETGIVAQTKQAYERARAGGYTGRTLNILFQNAARVNKDLRTHTDLQRGLSSVAGVSVDLANRTLGDLSRLGVLVIGAGETAQDLCKALRNHGCRKLIIANRTLARAQQLADQLGVARAVALDQWAEQVPEVDIIASATGAPGYIVTAHALAGQLAGRENRPLLLIDLAVPRDIDPACGALSGVTVHDLDAIQQVVEQTERARREQAELCEHQLDRHVSEFLGSLARTGPPR